MNHPSTMRKSEVPTSEEAVRMAVSKLDKAAQKGIIHPNQAARRKSRLMAKYNKQFTATEE